jgi:hypothetical protein
MHIEFDPLLTEEVVLREINRRATRGDPGVFEEYHRRIDPLYELPNREKLRRIREINDEFFAELGFSDIIPQVLDEFPVILKKVRTVYVGRAMQEDEADLAVNESLGAESPHPETLLLKLNTESFSDTERLRRVVRHELMHVQDMLDEDFGYEPVLLSLPFLERALVTRRYRVIWDIYIDARLLREGRETISNKEERRREFEALYLKIPLPERTQVFEGLWSLENLRHAEMLEFARDASSLLTRFTERRERVFLPGNPCPLCRFPTYRWMDNIEGVDEWVIRAIQSDFPDWGPEDGACERCIEIYQARASADPLNWGAETRRPRHKI